MSRNNFLRNELVSTVHEHGINIHTRELYLHGHIGESEEEPGVDYRMAVRLEKNLRLLNKSATLPILIHMHTGGGEWHDGMGIYDAIQSSPSIVTILGYGSISSMSSVILQAADFRVLMPHSEFMTHYGSIAVECNSVSAKSAIDWNEKCNKIMLEIYAEKCKEGGRFKGYSLSSIKKFIDTKMRQKQEWYLNSREAVEYGFADAVFGDDGCQSFCALLEE